MEFFEKLAEVCHQILLDDRKLLDYLINDRQIQKQNILKYKLGAFPKDLRLLYTEYDMDPKELRDNNIIWNANKSQFTLYPIVIPIRNIRGNTIAIGCRTLLSDDERKKIGIPKYRNSSYKKTSHLFGMDCAFGAIRNKNVAFVVEGYFDTLTAHQNKIYNVVATSGTILHPRQVSILSRYTDQICLLFDNDQPGRISAKKIMDRLRHLNGVNITCRVTPGKSKDLDEYLRNGGNMDTLIRKENQLVW